MDKPSRPHAWIDTEIVTFDSKKGWIDSIGIFGDPRIIVKVDFHQDPIACSWAHIYPIDTPWVPFTFNGLVQSNIEDWLYTIDCYRREPTGNIYDTLRVSLTDADYSDHSDIAFGGTLRQFFIKNRMDLI